MTKFYRTLASIMWVVGLAATVAAVVWRLVPHRGINLNVEMRSVLMLAGVLFVGAIATWAVGQRESR